jgi:hypothetical protein
MADEHLCHCGHENMFHASTNNHCMIDGCPCDEGFQPRWMSMSPRLKSALETQDLASRIDLRNLNEASR